jgi:hypothetical protein
VAGLLGNEVAYSNTGPLGETPTGLDFFSIARRSSTGWRSRGAAARGEGTQAIFETNPNPLSFSADMTATVFGANDVFVPEQEQGSPTPHIYRYSEDGLVEWLGKPTISEPLELKSGLGWFAGGSAGFETVYFDFPGTLTRADEEPNPALGNVSRAQEIQSGKPSQNEGFYEWHEGELTSAGVLPDGHLDPYGAVPAISADVGGVQEIGYQVSQDGRKAFFLSPDPKSGSGRPTEIYVRETAVDGTQATALVSRDTLLPEAGGLPAAAPGGVEGGTRRFYASPDGSRAFFESTEQLTADAPNDVNTKEYEFDVDTNTLTYLPGVADLSGNSIIEVLSSSQNGENFIFVRKGELELWSEGGVTEIAPYIEGEINLTRASTTGSAYVFQTRSPFTALKFNNGNGAYKQVYRYEVASSALSCVSCPPAGTVPSDSAELSHAFGSGNLGNTTGGISPGNRGISEDGKRVFFDTPDPLVPQDANGVRDAYEWEGGVVHLISTGVSQEQSFFGDTSPSGNDVFFSTSEGLSPGDKDEGYDVYDARVPRPGDQPPPAAIPCEGAVCQGPPSVPQLFSPPASEVFDGPGDLTAAPPSHSAQKSLTRKQKLTRALKACKHRKDARKRAKCERQARRSYGARAAGARTHGMQRNGNRQRNGRGK